MQSNISAGGGKIRVLPLSAVHEGELILVNRALPFLGETPPLAAVGSQSMAVTAARMLERLMARLDGWRSITPVSGWRSLEEQREIYAQSLRDSGQAFTEQFVALPGHSEHQTGLAMDLGLTQPEIDFIRPDFPDTGICGDFRALAASYGFIERYPAGKEPITGIAHEPWHFRYAGIPHAELMADRGWTLEEYHEAVKEHPLGREPLLWRTAGRTYRISYLAAAEEGVPLPLEGPCDISGDNEAGFVITCREEI